MTMEEERLTMCDELQELAAQMSKQVAYVNQHLEEPEESWAEHSSVAQV